MWIAAYAICAWLIASVVVVAFFALLMTGAKRGAAHAARLAPAQSIKGSSAGADEPGMSPSPKHHATA
jgi:hypothetical protein